MTTTATTPEQRLSVLQQLATGKHPAVVASILQLPLELVRDVANIYGPDLADLHEAAGRLARVMRGPGRCGA